MERRLNCYNYIFSTCQYGSKCPFGHVIVPNKEEYLAQYELNLNGIRDNTSPREFWFQNLQDNNSVTEMYTKAGKSASEYCEMNFMKCTQCQSLKWERKTYANYLIRREELYVCKECREKNMDSAGIKWPLKMQVYSL